MTTKIKLGIVAVGKIVQDQHLPSIENTGHYELIATASRHGSVAGIPAYTAIEDMLAKHPDIEAVSLCMPPQFRFEAAKIALDKGLDVLLEKPPGATVSEVQHLHHIAQQQNAVLYTTWHSKHGAAVEQAKLLLANECINKVEINWKESVRKWHPGQDWIWQAGGLGVFDPGINGLSILTHILPQAFIVTDSALTVPSNKAAPIAAKVNFETTAGAVINGEFDWRVEGGEEWTIRIKTANSEILLADGGAHLYVDGIQQQTPQHSPYGEYETIYHHFATLIKNRQCDVDLSPLQLVADAFLMGSHNSDVPFED